MPPKVFEDDRDDQGGRRDAGRESDLVGLAEVVAEQSFEVFVVDLAPYLHRSVLADDLVEGRKHVMGIAHGHDLGLLDEAQVHCGFPEIVECFSVWAWDPELLAQKWPPVQADLREE